MTPVTKKTPISLNDVPGWFFHLDQLLFRQILQWQASNEPRGDLLELGAYLGKSAILLGGQLAQGERFTVCDLFDSTPPDEANHEEMRDWYASLTRRTFESNYLSFHSELPVIVEGPTSIIAEHVAAGSCRFVHIDASHLYEHVHQDIAVSAQLLREDGVVVCDDYRSAHTPGVSAAVWEAVTAKGLNPICVSANKFYGTWGDPEPLREALLAWLPTRSDDWHEIQDIGPHRFLIIGTAKPRPRPTPPPPSLSRRIAKDLLPPVVTRVAKRGWKRIS